MKIKDLFEIQKENQVEDSYKWIEKEVHKVLDSGNKKELLDQDIKTLVYLVQNAKDGHTSLQHTPSRILIPLIQTWREKHAVKEDIEQTFTLQSRYRGEEWSNLADEQYSKDEAQEFLDDSLMKDELDYEERAISSDRKTILRASKKPVKSDGGNRLSRDMSPEVHKRNRDFFDKHL